MYEERTTVTRFFSLFSRETSPFLTPIHQLKYFKYGLYFNFCRKFGFIIVDSAESTNFAETPVFVILFLLISDTVFINSFSYAPLFDIKDESCARAFLHLSASWEKGTFCNARLQTNIFILPLTLFWARSHLYVISAISSTRHCQPATCTHPPV